MLELVLGYVVFRYVTHWLGGVVLGLVVVVALAVQGIWWPLAFLVTVIALVVGIVRHVVRLDAPVRPVGKRAAGFTYDAPPRRRGALRADARARLAPR